MAPAPGTPAVPSVPVPVAAGTPAPVTPPVAAPVAVPVAPAVTGTHVTPCCSTCNGGRACRHPGGSCHGAGGRQASGIRPRPVAKPAAPALRQPDLWPPMPSATATPVPDAGTATVHEISGTPVTVARPVAPHPFPGVVLPPTGAGVTDQQRRAGVRLPPAIDR
ncbi:hypothetical protein RAA17_05135 [Komagataeibacter rhaeticus]|nr:hypothetical protein [Komagataeibacter rhaeticus]